ncbi:MAG: hypothetical protein KDA85_14665, partial [Planctomycetaceae bacterium]|nr:hypothetical protein [Planctomycetaceae bacterium]
MSQPETAQKSRVSIPWLMLCMNGLLLTSAVWFFIQGRTQLAVSVLGASLLAGIWHTLLITSSRTNQKAPLTITRGLRPPHYVQASLQLCLYTYWGLYWDGVAAFIPLILVQLVFAYAMDSALAWTRYREWRVGFGPVPIVLSINLFLWFREEYFYLQFALIVLTYLCREYLHWNRNGRSTHIFNPSAFSLTAVSAILLLTGRLDLSRGTEIIESLTLPPNAFELIFLLGLVVQILFRTTLVTLSATVALLLNFHIASWLAGAPISRLPIEVSVFLGVTLLVTDPSTSPNTAVGKLMFGTIYGTGTFLAFVGLRWLQLPSFVDKIWMVPVVNLLVPLLDRSAAWISTVVASRGGRLTWQPNRFVWLGAYAAVFLLALTSLKNPVVQSQTLFPPPPTSTATPHM